MKLWKGNIFKYETSVGDTCSGLDTAEMDLATPGAPQRSLSRDGAEAKREESTHGVDAELQMTSNTTFRSREQRPGERILEDDHGRVPQMEDGPSCEAESQT